MIPDPDLIHYVCIAKDTTILAEFNFNDAATLREIAVQCLRKTPPLHVTFTHTIRSRTYAFFVADPFTYFSIFDENLENAVGLAFLRSVKGEFSVVYGNRLENLNSLCLQGEFNPILRQLLGLDLNHMETSEPRGILGRLKSNEDKGLKNKLLGECNKCGRANSEKANGEDEGKGIMINREVSLSVNKTRGFCSGVVLNHHQSAKKIWKKQVWIILLLDLLACLILFVLWLWICNGFKCINS